MKRALALVALLAGCAGPQSALDPAGPNASGIRDLLGLYVFVAAVVFVLVVGCVLLALARRRMRPGVTVEPTKHPSAEGERRTNRIVETLAALTALTLLGLTLADFRTRHAMAALDDQAEVTVKVTGHQWWWDFEYEDPRPDRIVTTSNELHVPVGRVVRLDLRASDVIHSFWVPTLAGKRDLVPGDPTSFTLRTDRAGRYFGQCAEFCGMQHATMRFAVVVEPEAEFRRWLDLQRAPALEPTTASAQHGREVFLGGPCVLCHAIAGTGASSHVGPDLTHVGSRPLLASGTLANSRTHFREWVANAPSIRPGVRMPPTALSDRDMNDLVTYLESLK